MPDDDFTPRLGRIGNQGKTERYLAKVVRAARRAGKRGTSGSRRFDGSRVGRGAARARVLASGDGSASFRARRVIVKTRLVMMKGKGLRAAVAHLRYIERDGVTRDGAPGQLYGPEQDEADGKGFLDRCDGDRHQFRFIVSPEDGDQYPDLKPFVRRLMDQMEEDLGTKLDWVAVDHHNTGHPHTHIILRGKDDRGQNLVIARDYISSGMRERASRIATLDLGPRTDLEIEQKRRIEMDAERLTSIDRGLIRDMDDQRAVGQAPEHGGEGALRMGRLRKLEKLGLATPLAGGRWQLADDLEQTLRRMGEQGDIVRTMQRELSARRLDPAPADRRIFDPALPGTAPLVGRVVMRGLADELEDRHFLIIDGVDGRTHYAAIGKGEATEALPVGAVVKVVPRATGVRQADRTIVDVAADNGGRYSAEAHLSHDNGAQEEFAQSHVRRLEAMRRVMGNVEREPDGSWIITPDHLDKAAAFEARLGRDRPVDVETLSAIPVEKLAGIEAPTWLDRELVSDAPVPLREGGFGQTVRAAQALRRQWLIDEGMAIEQAGQTRFRADLLATLQRRELLRVAGALSGELERPFVEMSEGERIEGRLVRAVDMVGGKHALIERARDFTLVPWRPVLEPRVGQIVSGVMRDGPISWTFGRERGGPGIS